MPVQPVLVIMDYRGGDRLRRCLAALDDAEPFFSRVILSITAADDSEDMAIARAYLDGRAAAGRPSKVELLCTGEELPTLAHQAFWVTHLESTGCRPDDWVLWLAYDDELRMRGIRALVDEDRGWPLRPGTAYFGPWAMRHETADGVWDGDPDAPLESWTSFPISGPTRLSVADWISRQLVQPTYLQMSGSVCRFASFLEMRDGRPRKQGPMRIEMAAMATGANEAVEEFAEPISIIYGRPNSDRASYGAAARREDVHLLGWLARYGLHRPSAIPGLVRGTVRVLRAYGRTALGRGAREVEAWTVRGTVQP